MTDISASSVVQLEDGGKVVRVPDLTKETSHVVFAQYTSQTLSPEKPYFRVKIVQLAKEAVVAVGISEETDFDMAETEDDERKKPNEKRRGDTVAYFSDDGSVANPALDGTKESVQTFGQGDVVGLCLDYHGKFKSLVCVFKNDQLIYRRWLSLKEDVLFPTLNVWWGTAELHVDWVGPPPPALSQDDLSHWNMPDTVTVDDSLLSQRTSSKVAAAQAPHPLHTCTSQYMEMTIVSVGEEAEMGPVLGLTSALLEDNILPGTMQEAIGYSAVDGTVYFETKVNATALGDDCKCGAGDTMGCGLVFASTETFDPKLAVKVIVYFTKNGREVFHRHLNQPLAGFYPTVGLSGQGCTVRVNTQCPAPQGLDIEAWREKANQLSFGLGNFGLSFRMPQSSSHSHKEGQKSGDYRFNDLLGVPGEDDTVRPKEKASSGQLIQRLQTMTRERPYFTVTVLDDDPDGTVTMGISRDDQSVGSMPGGIVDSVGYSSSGSINNGVDGFKGDKYTRGDVVGCFIEHFDSAVKIVQFVKNGRLVGTASLSGGSRDLYPSLGFSGEPCTVKVTWPESNPTPPGTFTKANLANWMKSSGLCVEASRLSVQKKKRKLKALCMRSPQPLTKEWSYFEVAVHANLIRSQDKKISKAPIIGLSNQMGDKPFKRIKMDSQARDIRFYCHSNSIGYKDALCFEMLPQKEHLESGDRIGFGILYPDIKNKPGPRARQVVVVFCVLNGAIIYHQAMEQPSGGFYPIVSLYKYGNQVEIREDCSPPIIANQVAWMAEADQLRRNIKQARKDADGDHKMTAEERQVRPASPMERAQNHLNKYKIHIYCDPMRYNEATYVQAGLEAKGFSTVLPPRESLNSSHPGADVVASIRSCETLACCMGPEIGDSKLARAVLDLCKESGRPILPCILSHVDWPTAGLNQDHFSMLTMDKIEMTEDFDWGVDQIEEKSLNLKGKGYNGKLIKVEMGDGAKMLYTDAQKGDKTANKASDPDALKRAVADADRRKATSFGNTDPADPPPGPRAAPGEPRPRSVNSTKHMRAPSGRPRSQSAGVSGKGSGSVQSSKTCLIL